MSDKPVTHGIEHRPSSYDPSCTDPWTYVLASGTGPAWSGSTTYHAGSSSSAGDTVVDGVYRYQCVQMNKNVEPGVNALWARYWRIDAPLFQNSWANSGGTLAHMRYRLSVGPPHVTDESDGSVIDYSDHQVEIQGSAVGGADATTVFTLPPAYAPDVELHLSASDDLGFFVVLRVLSTGDVIRGL